MAVPLEQFVKQLEDSGILAGDTLKEFLPPNSEPKDAEDLARELIRKKKLTKYQAEEVYRGKGKALVLGNYTILDKIGAGGMGQVFKAEHRRMHRTVAVKMLPTGMMQDPAVVARFEREVTAAAKLTHPNIVTAFDADNANGVHLLIMEYVEGSDLSASVKKNGPLPVEQALSYILQAARGLEAAHAEGIVHRDIKPANLLLDKKGVVKILDMGLARLSADADSEKQAELTNTGTVMGTVDYMAPEQALNTKTADARADIYSLGCSLYYLLTGKATYSGDTLMAKLLAHRDQPIPVLRTIRPEVPEQVEAVFSRMVAKKVEDRYQTMTAVIADLETLSNRQAPSSNTSMSLGASTDEGLTNFFKDISLSEANPVRRNKPAGLAFGKEKKKYLLIGGGILGGLLLLAVLAASFKKTEETLVVITPKPAKLEGKSVKPSSNPPSEKWNTPAFQEWMKDVERMPADEQLQAVSKKLRELNQGFDGKIRGMFGGSPLVENGAVREIGLVTDQVTDISPVLALKWLRCLNCSGMNERKLSDLRPLKGMKLVALSAQGTLIDDLTPLIGMPLERLWFFGSPIKSLSPIKNMPLTDLSLTSLEDGDLSPLEGIKLVNLTLSGMNFEDISVFKGMPLRSLVIPNTRVSDLSPLKEMPLEVLWCNHTQVSDLSPLQGMNLKTLFFTPENITLGMDVIRQMKSIESISIDGSNKISPDEFWKRFDAGEFGKPQSQ